MKRNQNPMRKSFWPALMRWTTQQNPFTLGLVESEIEKDEDSPGGAAVLVKIPLDKRNRTTADYQPMNNESQLLDRLTHKPPLTSSPAKEMKFNFLFMIIERLETSLCRTHQQNEELYPSKLLLLKNERWKMATERREVYDGHAV